MECERSCYSRGTVPVHVSLPQQLTGGCIKRVNICRKVPDVDGIRRGTEGADRNCGTDTGVGCEHPVNAACASIERVNAAALASNKHTIAVDRRLTISLDVA